MPIINTLFGRLGMFALTLFLSLPVLCRAASQEKLLYTFNCTSGHCGIASSNDSNLSGMIFDAAGNLYGASVSELSSGSNCNGYACGYIFELTPTKSGPWKEKTLYNFCSLTNCADGAVPLAGLVFDSAGNLYGTTGYGGTSVPGCGGLGCGTVFELTPGSSGNWTEKVLYNFKGGGTDGSLPGTTPIFDKTGNLYGTTGSGGSYGYGTVFELIFASGGGWAEKVLHNFRNNGKDGNFPIGSIAFDKLGRLYESTVAGGKYTGSDCQNDDGNTCGTVYILTPKNATWTESILHDFQDDAADAVSPLFGVILDANGNVYGATEVGGAYDGGTVFELTHGTWAEHILVSFQIGNGIDVPAGGCFPLGGVVFGKSGGLYGTTNSCGLSYGPGGVVFELSPSGGLWTETVLWDFANTGGSGVAGLLTLDAAGNSYGLVDSGVGDGFAFEVKP